MLRHDRGETDDHLWTEWEGRNVLFVGDFLVWNFPNCGNPQKVLRYPAEWAAALRSMLARSPELVASPTGSRSPGSIVVVLDSTAGALEGLVAAVIERLNADATLDEVLHEVRVPEEGCNFRGCARSTTSPSSSCATCGAPTGLVGREPGPPASGSGGRGGERGRRIPPEEAGRLAERAQAVAESGDLRLACELVELAATAAPEDAGVHRVRAEVRPASGSGVLAHGEGHLRGCRARASADVAGIEVPEMRRGFARWRDRQASPVWPVAMAAAQR
ncbi:MAG: hypothetical protein R2715_10710 [Ilumatobacteraceae bacterium]